MAVSQGNVSGWGAVLLGAPFIAAGVLLFGLGGGWWPGEMGRIRVPPVFVQAFGVCFALCGIYVFLLGMKRVSAQRFAAQARIRNPDQPWLWDYRWNMRGIASRVELRNWLSHIIGIAVTAVFLAFTYWLGFVEGGTRLPFYGVCLFALLVAYGFLRLIVQRLRYGRGRVDFLQFPFKLGESCAVRVHGLPKPQAVKKVIATLIYCEEKYIYKRNRANSVSVAVKHSEQVEQPGSAIQLNGTLDLEIPLPDDPHLGSRLSERPARFWELVIRCEQSGADYEERYLMPVYAPRAAYQA